MRSYTTHRNKDFSLKSLEVLIILTELLVKYMLRDKEKYKYLFTVIINKILNDLSNHENKKKDEKNDGNEKKGFSLLTVVRLIGLMAAAYLEYKGPVEYRKVFNYVIKKCTKKILLDNKY